MKSEFADGQVTLYFVGDVNSTNASIIEKEVEESLKGKTVTSVVLDFRDLNYISSAGLRIVLKLRQRYGNTSVINASLSVYDILDMTGFTNIISVSKIMLSVSVEGAEVVGSGYFSTVYRIDKDTIVKVFNRTSDEGQIQRELDLAKEAFILGIPTAISYDVVKVGDKLGVRFEMLDCDSLRNVYIKHPDQYEELTKKYSDLLKTINSLEPLKENLRRTKDFYFEKLDYVKGAFDETTCQRIYGLLSDIEDRPTFVHGDCHFKNIMVQDGELLLIDMDTLSVGDPIFEYAAIYAPYIAFEEDDPGNNMRFLGVSCEFTKKIMRDLVSLAFGDEHLEENMKKIAFVSYLHMMWWNRVNEPENEKRFEGCKGRLLALLEEIDNLRI